MKTITININENIDKEFREITEKELGKGKGKLGKAFEESLKLWIKEKKEEEIAFRQLSFMEKGFTLGKYRFNRDELHERN